MVLFDGGVVMQDCSNKPFYGFDARMLAFDLKELIELSAIKVANSSAKCSRAFRAGTDDFTWLLSKLETLIF